MLASKVVLHFSPRVSQKLKFYGVMQFQILKTRNVKADNKKTIMGGCHYLSLLLLVGISTKLT